jgi:sigma-B regulation protein RsbU (phosphoserine phosphatase)
MPPERLRILLVEHDEGFARYVAEMLGQMRDMAAEIRTAPDLESGLAAAEREQADAVLLDLYLPDGAGLANIGLFRAVAPQLPVIAAGSADEQDIALEAVHAGAQDYLVKSQLTPAWLERSIRYAIERYHMDLALLAAEEKYHGVFDHLIEGIFQTTPAGRYLMANAALARIYGYSCPEEMMEEIKDIGARVYVQPGRRDEFVRLMQEQGVITNFESQTYRKDGSVMWISENCRAIRDSRGRLLYYEGTVMDITQRRQAEENLRNSEALYHSLVETLPQNIFRKDPEGRFTFCNQHFCRIVARPFAEIIGKTDFDFFPRELAEKYQADDRRVLESGKPYETVEEHQPPGRDKIYVQVVKTPLYGGDGKIMGLQGIFWDITQQRQAEEGIRRANVLLEQSRRELQARNQQMEENLTMAREIQLAMLPQQYPAFPRSGPGSESVFQFTHRYQPTESVGGDFFTVSALSETEAAVFICDVAGHSIRSALVTAMIRALVEELKPVAPNPGQFLTQLNRDLCVILKNPGTPLLTTAIYLVADSKTGVVSYANAGHPKPLHLRRSAGQVVALANASGKPQPALGLFENATYQGSLVKLSPQDLIMLFTDGLIEVQGRNDEFYTSALLLSAVQERVQLPAEQLFDEVLAEIRAFAASGTFSDDICLVGMEFAGAEIAAGA